MAESKTILVTAASGNIGQTLVPLLLSSQSSPRVVLPTTSRSKLQSAITSLTSSPQNVIIEEGTVRDPVWFQSLLSTYSVTDVLLCLTGIDELYTGLLCLDAMSRIPSIKRLVYISAIGDFMSDQGFKECIVTRPYPHMFAKVVMEQRIRHGDLPFDWTVLGPGFFFSNDVKQNPTLRNGTFSTPLLSGKGAKVAPEDIALAAKNALLDTSGIWSHKKISLGSKHGYRGEEVKDIWSKALNRDIEGYWISDESLDAWEQRMRSFMPSDDGRALVRNLTILFRSLEGRDLVLSDAEYAAQVKLLGREPTGYEAWVGQTVAGWLSDPGKTK